MKKYAEQLESLSKAINDLINGDSTNEFINAINGIKSQVDGLSEIHNKTEKDLSEMKDLYIGAIKNEGSKDAPKSDIPEPQKPKTLEELASEVIANRKP